MFVRKDRFYAPDILKKMDVAKAKNTILTYYNINILATLMKSDKPEIRIGTVYLLNL